MRWVALGFILALIASKAFGVDENFQFAPLFSFHDTQRKVDEEFRNIGENLQSQQFSIFLGTPTLKAVKDGSLFIIFGGSMTTTTALGWRKGNELYRVIGSCITVTR